MLAALLIACQPQTEDTAPIAPDEPLIDAAGWALVSADEDPFSDRFEVDCHGAGFGPEGSAFEVQTDLCPYATLSQPLPWDLPAGATLVIDAWHLELSAAEPAEGHLAVRVGKSVAEVRPAIPGEPAAYTLALLLGEDAAAGEPIFFHVHNHGSNSWYLGNIEVQEGE